MDNFTILDNVINFFNNYSNKNNGSFLNRKFIEDISKESFNIFGCKFIPQNIEKESHSFVFDEIYPNTNEKLSLYFYNTTKYKCKTYYTILINDEIYINYFTENNIHATISEKDMIYDIFINDNTKTIEKYEIIYTSKLLPLETKYIFSKNRKLDYFTSNYYKLSNYNTDNIVINNFTKSLIIKDIELAISNRDITRFGSYLKEIEKKYGKNISEFTEEEQFYIMLNEK